MDRDEEEEEEKVFVCSLGYSTLMDSSGTTDQDEKTSIEEASTSGASSGSGSESPGSPTPLVSERIVDVSQNGLSFTTVKHSPLFRTRLPHLSAHSLALTAGNRKQRYRSPYAPSGQYAQPQSYDKWSKQRSKSSKWTRRRRLERPLLWLATAILILLLIAGIMIAVFWVSGSNKDGQDAKVLLNTTNTTTATIPIGPGSIITNLSTTSLMTKMTSLPTSPPPTTLPPSTTTLKTTTPTTSSTSPTTTSSTTTISTTTPTTTSTIKTTLPTTTPTTRKATEISSSTTTTVSTTSQRSPLDSQTTPAIYILTDKTTKSTTTTPASSTLPSNLVPGALDTNITPVGDLSEEKTENKNATEKPP